MKPFVALGPPSETLLAKRAGYRPLGAVVGVAVVSLGNPNAQSGLNGAELRVHTDAVTTGLVNARRRAVEQAAALGASGVVGVQLDFRHDPGSLFTEVRCVGTAVAGGEATDVPFLCNLHGADLVALEAAGYRPVGLAVGFCFYTQVAGIQTDNARRNAQLGLPTFNGIGLRPYEHPDYTHATYAARGIAMGRLDADARSVGAEGIVGVELDPKIGRHHESLHVALVLVGTAIRRHRWGRTGPKSPSIFVPLGRD